MVTVGFSPVDAAICVVVALSFILGWVRGATREVLSVVAWGGGIYFSIALFPHAREFTRLYIEHKLISDFVTACGLFIIFLTILSVFNYFCSNFVKKSVLNATDKALGGIFGIIRGVVVLAVCDVAAGQFMSGDTPKWMENSSLRPLIGSVSNMVILVMPESLQEKVVAHMSQVKRQSLMDFVKDNVMENIDASEHDTDPHKNSATGVIARNANEQITKSYAAEEDGVLEEDEMQIDKKQTAEELATLKPKKSTVEKKGKNTTRRERNDMDRLLDQYDDIDEG
ncbi:MAG: CvpA family protein [Alphaproteobacteria bacterium]|nr:CvpA family protein [Alphaproteobacteria bacterium]